MKLNIFTELNNFSYGVMGRNISLELNRNTDVTIAPNFPAISGIEDIEWEHIKKMLDKFSDIDLNQTGIMFGNGNLMHRFCGSRRIGFTLFFCTELDRSWINQLKQLDLVCVPSEWQQKVLEKYSINSVIIPAGVNTDYFFPAQNRNNTFDKNNKFKFFSIGKWDTRKNQTLVIDAFCEEFDKEENAELYLMCYNPFTKNSYVPEILAHITNNHRLYSKEFPDKADIFILNPVRKISMLSNIYRRMNCCVFPFRAEPLGLRVIESMACGIPCIITGYSAVIQFADESVCSVLKNFELKNINTCKGYENVKGVWAEPDKTELRKAMRTVFENYSDAEIKAEKAAFKMKKYFWWNSANKLLSSVLNIV